MKFTPKFYPSVRGLSDFLLHYLTRQISEAECIILCIGKNTDCPLTFGHSFLCRPKKWKISKDSVRCSWITHQFQQNSKLEILQWFHLAVRIWLSLNCCRVLGFGRCCFLCLIRFFLFCDRENWTEPEKKNVCGQSKTWDLLSMKNVFFHISICKYFQKLEGDR